MTSWSLSLWLKYSMGKSAWLFYQVLVVKPPECVLRRPISCLHYIFNRNTLPKGDRYWGQTSGMPCKFMATPAFLRMSFSQCPIVADVTGKGESASNHSDNHSQPWFPVLMEMITDTPLLLPAIMDLLLDPQGNPHPLMVQGHLQLVAWSVSGQPSKVEAFQRMQLQSSVLPGGPTLKLPTLVPGTNGQDGANKFI